MTDRDRDPAPTTSPQPIGPPHPPAERTERQMIGQDWQVIGWLTPVGDEQRDRVRLEPGDTGPADERWAQP